MEKTRKQQQILFSWARKSLWIVTAATKLKDAAVFSFSPSIGHEVMGPDAMILVFLNVEP